MPGFLTPRFRRRLIVAATSLTLVIGSIALVQPAHADTQTALSRSGWVASASVSGTDVPANMLDGNAATRWSTGTAMVPGQSVTIDMAAAHSLDRITMDSGPSSGDFARGYQVYLSADGTSWGTAVATGTGSGALVDVGFAARTARYVKVVQTGSAGNWWSVAEFNAYTGPAALSRSGWSATASVTDPGEPASNMLDGNAATRWSTGTAMVPGQSVTIDMAAAHSIGEITMDSGASTGDYARGYQVYLSADGTSWGTAVATGTGSGALVDVAFTARTARYIKVVQTGSAGNWWSVAEFNAYGATTVPVAPWVGGWTAALAAGGNGIINQTVRMVVHNTTPGSSVRIRLSNVYGLNALPVGAVDIAVQASGGTVVPGSRHVVTFGGSPTTTVPTGVDLASDPVAMAVTAEENLLVSVYFSGNAGASGWHYDGRDVTYYSSSGNFAADDAVTNYPAADNSWYYLDGLDVQPSTARGTLVAFGDSITDGANSSLSTNSRWPNALARRLQAQPGGPVLGVVDAGIGGNRVLTDTNSQFGSSALHRFAHDALGEPGVKDVILLEGINDIGTGIGPNGALTAQDLIAGYQTLIAQAHAAGVKIYGATILPYQGAGYYTANGETIRETVNTWILTSGAYDGTFDLAAAMGGPSNALVLNPAYDSGDHLHPNDAGYQAMANAVDLTKLA